MRYTDTLYECRGCFGVTVRETVRCPYCNKRKGPEVTHKTPDGGTRTTHRAWYKEVRIENHE